MDSRDDHLHRLAEHQHGLVTRAQMDAAGVGRSGRRHRLARGEWEQLSPRVLQRRGAPATSAQAAMAAVLDVGPSSYLSHWSAAAVWGVPGARLAPHHVIVVRPRAPQVSSLATVHRPRHLTDPFAAMLDGLPVVRPELTLLQMAAHLHPGRLARWVDRMWSDGLVSGRSLRRHLGPLMHRGRAGTAAMRQVLDDRPDTYVPPASGLEGRFVEVAREAGLRFRRQVDLGGDEQWCGRVDFLAEDLPLVVEVDSERYHAALVDRAADAAREARLVAAGFTVVRVTDHQVWYDRPAVVRAVLAGRARASARRRSAA